MKLCHLHLEAFNPSKFMGQATAIGEREGLEPDEVMEIAADADPTEHKEYTRWILARWKDLNVRLPEDGRRVKESLALFHKFKRSNKISEKDIYKYKTIRHLEDAVEPLTGVGTNRSGGFRVDPLSLPGVAVVAKDGDAFILEVSDPESLAKLGLGTKWCTREDYPDCAASDYLDVFDAIYIYAEGNKPLIQFTPDFDQVMDVHDEPVAELPPLLLKFAYRLLNTKDPEQLRGVLNAIPYVYKQMGSQAIAGAADVVLEVAKTVADDSPFSGSASLVTDYIELLHNFGLQWSGFEEVVWPAIKRMIGGPYDMTAAIQWALLSRERMPIETEEYVLRSAILHGQYIVTLISMYVVRHILPHLDVGDVKRLIDHLLDNGVAGEDVEKAFIVFQWCIYHPDKLSQLDDDVHGVEKISYHYRHGRGALGHMARQALSRIRNLVA